MPQQRVADPSVSCPEARLLHVGRNAISGFGRMQNCDRLRIENSAQSSARARFSVEARCLRTNAPLSLTARLRTANRVVFDGTFPRVILSQRADGYAQRIAVVLDVIGPGPFFEFEGAEADLEVTLTDADGNAVSDHLRLVLTFNVLTDLPS